MKKITGKFLVGLLFLSSVSGTYTMGSRAVRPASLSSEQKLCSAVIKGQIQKVLSILQNVKVDVNFEFGRLSPLHRAARNGYKEIVEVLLQDENILINKQGLEGYTALHWAAYQGYTEVVDLLLAYGARTDLCTEGDSPKTPYDLAVMQGNLQTAQVIKSDGM